MRKNIKDELTEARSENALLRKELDHRVKNNLQLMDSLLKLQMATLIDPIARKALLATQRRLHALSVANAILLDGREADRLDLFSLMQDLTKELIYSYDPSSHDVGITLTGKCVRIDADFIVPLGLITGEIIANTLDHAQSKENRVRMEISWTGGDSGAVSLRYRDDGGGFPEEATARLRESLGLMLIRSLAAQIHATVAISNDERGAVTLVEFRPIA